MFVRSVELGASQKPGHGFRSEVVDVPVDESDRCPGDHVGVGPCGIRGLVEQEPDVASFVDRRRPIQERAERHQLIDGEVGRTEDQGRRAQNRGMAEEDGLQSELDDIVQSPSRRVGQVDPHGSGWPLLLHRVHEGRAVPPS